MNKKIEVIILANNEEDAIEDAIMSVKGWASKVIVIDAGSTDRTIQIAKSLGAQVINHELINFSDQRNFAAKKTESEWIFYLDADERVTEKFKEEVDKEIEEKEYDGFMVQRETYFFGKKWGLTDKVLRLIKSEKLENWTGVVHETAHVDGKIGTIQSPVKHFTHRNLEQMLEKTNKWSEYEAKLRFDSKHPKMESWRFIRLMISEFMKSYFKENGYKNGIYGFVEAIYQSYSIFITYAKLWEMQNNKS